MSVSIHIKREYHCDVCVLGGGPAGFAAAAAAGRNGADTILVEKYGMPGGAMTIGGVPLPGLFHAHGRQVISGIGWELMERLARKGWAKLPKPPYEGPHPSIQVSVNGFEAACEMDDICQEAGVRFLFHHQAADVLTENQQVTAVILSGHEGLSVVRAKVFIDCTGDGDIAALAGAEYELGDILQPGSLNFVLEGIDLAKVDREDANRKYAKAVAEGRLHRQDVWSGGGEVCYAIWGGLGSNLNHVYPLDGSDSESRSDAETGARASVRRLLAWMRAEIPGCEHASVSACSPESWARESRRILGRAYITGEDYVDGVVPADSVCYSFYPIDIHTHEKNPLQNIRLQKGRVPGIPYSALIPKGFDNLLMAGRCISGDRAAQSAYRVQASCMATGEASGTAAALAAAEDLPVWDISVPRLQETLKKQGAIVPESCV